MQRILITGAAGSIGRRLRADMQGLYPILRLSDRDRAGARRCRRGGDRGRSWRPCRLRGDLRRRRRHRPSRRPLGRGRWETVLQANIVGCYNVFEAARRQGVKRVVFATTNHVDRLLSAHAAHRPRRPAAPGQPLRRHQGVRRGAGRLYADKHGMRVLSSGSAISATGRSTGAGSRSGSARATSCSWCGSGWSIPDLRFEIVYGASENDRSWYDNANAYRLGYRPQDDSEPYAAEYSRPRGSPPISWPSSSKAGRSARPSSTAMRNGSTDGCSLARAPAAADEALLLLGRQRSATRLQSRLIGLPHAEVAQEIRDWPFIRHWPRGSRLARRAEFLAVAERRASRCVGDRRSTGAAAVETKRRGAAVGIGAILVVHDPAVGDVAMVAVEQQIEQWRFPPGHPTRPPPPASLCPA